jgi:hypothetical protein
MKIEEINNAIEIIEKQENLNSKRGVFLILASLNLLNAAIKQLEFKKLLSYGFIKTRVTKLFEYLILNEDKKLVSQVYYSVKEKCLYFKIYGMILSFHDIYGAHGLIQTFAFSSKNKLIEWDGISKQAIASELFSVAKKNTETNFDVSGEIVKLLNLSRQYSKENCRRKSRTHQRTK